MIKNRVLCALFVWLVLFSVHSQGSLELSPDPQEQLIQRIETTDEFLSVPDIPVLYTHPNDGRLAEVAYGQFSRVLKRLSETMDTGGVQGGYEEIPRVREILEEWVLFWNSYMFLPEDGQITAKQIREFLETIQKIDTEISLSIALMNQIVDQERILTSENYKF